MSPYFMTDAGTAGVVQVSNLASSPIQVGVGMKVANTSLPPLTTEVFKVEANSTSTLDLRHYLDHVPDGVLATGCLEVFHNGQPGTVTATFTTLGDATEVAMGYPLSGAPPLGSGAVVVFPNSLIVQGGEVVQIDVLSDSTQPPTWSASGGVVTPIPSTDPLFYSAIFEAPDDDDDGDEFETVIIEATSSGGVGTTQVEIQKVKLQRIETRTAQGQDTGGRLNPDGDTTFILTGKKDFPAVPLQVRFKQGDLEVEVEIGLSSQARPTPRQLVGEAPVNTLFVGESGVEVRAGSKRVSKKKDLCNPQDCEPGDEDCERRVCGVYYAFDPPSPPTSLSPGGFNRTGGNLTITAAGGGFRDFTSSVSQERVDPSVRIGAIGFQVSTVDLTTINGNVLRAGCHIASCQAEGVTPCKRVSVKNPGGRRRDRVFSTVHLYNLLPGPAPVIQSIEPNIGDSIGGTEVTLRGVDLDCITSVTFRSIEARTITSQSRTRIVAPSPPNCLGDARIEVFSVDNLSASREGFRYHASRPTRGPLSILGDVFVVGGCTEGIMAELTGSSPACITNITLTVDEVQLPDPRLPGLSPSVRAFSVSVTFNRTACPPGANQVASFQVRLINTADETRRRSVTLTRNFSN